MKNRYIFIFFLNIKMNKELIEQLQILELYHKALYTKTKNPQENFRKMAYIKAIKAINNLDFEIENISQIKKIKGIGKSILTKIEQFLETGNIKKVYELKKISEPSEKEKVIETFLNIWGVGDINAEKLWKEGYRSIEDIRKNPSVLNRQQLIGLKYYEDLLKRIPRIKIIVLQTIIRYILNKYFGKNSYELKVSGSYRRGKDTSGDVDILITSDKFNLNDIVSLLEKWNIITDTLSLKEEKFMGIAHCPGGLNHAVRLDIEFLPKEEFAFGLLYFTGSKDFNREIRQHAKKLGYTLNQHGLFKKNGNKILANTEEEIFDKLNLVYVSPKKRN